MPQFFLPPSAFSAKRITLTGETAGHIKVLRLRTGDPVTFFDGEGMLYYCTLISCDNGEYLVEINDSKPSQAEPAVSVSIFMAYAKSDKLEHVIQKATELGAFEIVAFPSDRCVSKPNERIAKKLERWNKIALSAAEQSGRGRIPVVRTVSTYAEAIREATAADIPLFFYEGNTDTSLRGALSGSHAASISLMTGPEGGFSAKEVALASEAGMQICTLGPRILRCETAPLCALSAVLYAVGEI